MDPASLEFWEWFYEVANQGASWSPEERHRYLILLETSGRARRSGLELGGRGWDLGHIVTLREGKAERMEVHPGWDAAREAAGLG